MSNKIFDLKNWYDRSEIWRTTVLYYSYVRQFNLFLKRCII